MAWMIYFGAIVAFYVLAMATLLLTGGLRDRWGILWGRQRRPKKGPEK